MDFSHTLNLAMVGLGSSKVLFSTGWNIKTIEYTSRGLHRFCYGGIRMNMFKKNMFKKQHISGIFGYG